MRLDGFFSAESLGDRLTFIFICYPLWLTGLEAPTKLPGVTESSRYIPPIKHCSKFSNTSSVAGEDGGNGEGGGRSVKRGEDSCPCRNRAQRSWDIDN